MLCDLRSRTSGDLTDEMRQTLETLGICIEICDCQYYVDGFPPQNAVSIIMRRGKVMTDHVIMESRFAELWPIVFSDMVKQLQRAHES